MNGDLQIGAAGDHDAMAATALRGVRPVGRALVVDARDVLDDEQRRAAAHAAHFESKRTLRARVELPHAGNLDRARERPALDQRFDAIDRAAEPVAEQADLLKRLIGDGAGRTLALKVLRPTAGVVAVVHLIVTPNPS